MTEAEMNVQLRHKCNYLDLMAPLCQWEKWPIQIPFSLLPRVMWWRLEYTRILKECNALEVALGL
jgi:hypothetical protein